MKSRLITFLATGFCFIAMVHAQTNEFPASGNVGIGTTAPSALLHILTGGSVSPSYPSSTIQGDIFGLMQADNNAMEFGVGKGINTRRAWILARHASTAGFGKYYATLHLQPGLDDMSQYRGVAIGYTASSSLPLQVGLAVNGNVGIGTTNPQAKLAVNGTVLAKEVKVKNDISVPDYVFEPDYDLPALDEIEAYIKEHKHLPEIPSAKDIEMEGLNLAEMNLLLLKKVEELTLHLIQQEKKIGSQDRKIERLEQQLNRSLSQNSSDR